mgnify:CR=1 FL=1
MRRGLICLAASTRLVDLSLLLEVPPYLRDCWLLTSEPDKHQSETHVVSQTKSGIFLTFGGRLLGGRTVFDANDAQ